MSEAIQLHSVLVFIKGHQGFVQFIFKSEEKASSALSKFGADMGKDMAPCSIGDDFGRFMITLGHNIDAVQIIDHVQELESQAEIQILQAHANVKLQKRAQRDPMLGGGVQLVQAAPMPVVPFPPNGRNSPGR